MRLVSYKKKKCILFVIQTMLPTHLTCWVGDFLDNRQLYETILNKKLDSMSEVDRTVFIIIVTLTVPLLLSSVYTLNIREIACHSIVQTVKGYFCVHFATISLTFMHIL